MYLYFDHTNKGIIDEFKNDNETFNEFGPLTNINILVGANNSRKSRLLRYLLKKNEYISVSEKLANKIIETEECVKKLLQLSNGEKIIGFSINKNLINADHYNEEVKMVIEKVKVNNSFTSQTIIDEKYLNKLLKTVKSFSDDYQHFKAELEKYVLGLKMLVNVQNLKSSILYTHSINIDTPFTLNSKALLEIINIASTLVTILEQIYEMEIKKIVKNRIYIPTLRRGISIFQNGEKLESNIYKDTIKQLYNLQENDFLEIFTGLDFYKKIKSARNDKREVRDRFSAFEQFVSNTFFNGREVDIVAKDSDDKAEQHIQLYLSDDSEQFFHDIGDGIQNILILLYPIFMAEPNSWIFIEEPEQNLHPRMQTIFLDVLVNSKEIKDKELKFFITTHSNHLLDSLLKFPEMVTIFSLEAINDGKSNYSNISKIETNFIKPLDLLGVYNSSVFMSNCSIWVEGISDRRYIQAFLHAYIRDNNKIDFKEGLHYSFFEYAGSNLSHYLFEEETQEDRKENIEAFLLSNRIFLLADEDDKETEYKQKRHKELKKLSDKKDNFKYMTTEVKEIENLLSPVILHSILKSLGTKAIPEEVCKKHIVSYEDYKVMGMGKYLTHILKGKQHKGEKINVPKLSEKSGTLTHDYKMKFSEHVLNKVYEGEITWDMIKYHPSAKKLTENIYKFIEKNNFRKDSDERMSD